MSQPTILSLHAPDQLKGACLAYDLTPSEFDVLRAAADTAKTLAYCPYSRFRVGAAVLCPDRSVVTGANVENAAYPVGTCAERVAIGRAVTRSEGEGGPVRKIRAVAVATDVSPPASPCGMCRQFIREFMDLDAPIIMFDSQEQYVIMPLEKLLPLSFGPDKLPPPGAPGSQG